MRLYATCAKASEAVVADELRALGAAAVEPQLAGVAFTGELQTAYRACLWSRVANRVLLPLATFAAPTAEALYEGVQAIEWGEHIAPDGTLAVDGRIGRSRPDAQINHSHFLALKTKDAIVDQLRAKFGRRPDVERARPDVRVNLHLSDDVATVSIDLSGESLHRRGWRGEGGAAPLKETLAAAVLLIGGWPEVARAGGPLVDPMCGSGTFLIEAAGIARDHAPGLGRPYFGFLGWRGHDAALWARLGEEARGRAAAGAVRSAIIGWDADAAAVRVALDNVERAGLRGVVHVERRELAALAPPAGPPGLVVTNPPYGERLGDAAALGPLYEQLGDALRHRCAGWTALVLTGNLELAGRIGLRARRRHVLYNGAIECRLLEYPISTAPVIGEGGPGWRRARERPSPAAEMFVNRLRKNVKHWQKWAEREEIYCYRVYDADLPEYAVAVDLYDGAAHIQEYQPPQTVDAAKAERRLRDIELTAPEVLSLADEDVYWKTRRRQRGGEQYEKLDVTGQQRQVREGGHRFLVNLNDYLDTGLFLDHRRLRALVAELATGRDFLNLFSYTGSATVYAAKAGARSTTSVDLSNTYLDWATENLRLNKVAAGPQELIRADVMAWLPAERRRYGLILMTPPTFSNSKRMEDTLDVQRDHVPLIRAAAERLTPDGILLFSNHFRRFKMDMGALDGLRVENITAQTIPKDFGRDPRIHNAWKITAV